MVLDNNVDIHLLVAIESRLLYGDGFLLGQLHQHIASRGHNDEEDYAQERDDDEGVDLEV